jgi:undecaprenyl-diphosphatase
MDMGILDSLGSVVREADLRLACELHGWSQGVCAGAIVALTWIGSGWSALALLPLARHRRTREFARRLLGALAAQAVLVWAIKGGTARVRPWIALGWPAPLWAPHDGSFPSGHSAGSFCVAAFLLVWPPASDAARGIAKRIPGITAAAIAALLAVSRVAAGAHFPSDVVAGAIVGLLVGALAARRRAFGVEARGESRY